MTALPNAVVTVTALFEDSDDSADRFILASFPSADSRGNEPSVFAFARALKGMVGAVEANPAMTDSIAGGAQVANVPNESVLSRLCETDRDESLPKAWVHSVLDTPAAWQENQGDNVLIGVIDTGHSDHPELDGAIRADLGRNLVEGGSDARDRFSRDVRFATPGHGTLVCSVVASRGGVDSSGGTTAPGLVTGAAPAAEIVPIRAIRSVIDFKQSRIPRAIRYATDAGCAVIAMALGGPTRVSAVERALRYAVASGVVVICAAGNCWPFVVYPAAYARQKLAAAVAAVASDLRPWAKTGRGRAVTFSAPGENVWGASKRQAHEPGMVNPTQGTTLATSLTAGVAALWVAHHGGRDALKTVAEAKGTTVQSLFMQAATFGLEPPPVWDGSRRLGAGVLNAQSLLAFDLDTATAVERQSAEMSAEAHLVPTIEILAQHLSDADIDIEDLDADAAPLAPELLWLSFQKGARDRAAAIEDLEIPLKHIGASDETAAYLARRPKLAAAILG